MNIKEIALAAGAVIIAADVLSAAAYREKVDVIPLVAGGGLILYGLWK